MCLLIIQLITIITTQNLNRDASAKMSTRSHKQLQTNTSVTHKNTSQGLNNQSKSKSTAAVSNKKIARDLREEFDQYVLREDPKEEEDDEPEPNQQQFQQQKQEQGESGRNVLRDSVQINRRVQSKHQSASKKSQQFRRSTQKANNIRISSLMRNQTVGIPKSYLLAMQHLQDLVESKDRQIEDLKNELLQKEQIILDSQTRINQILVKYHQLMEMYSKKQIEIQLIKQNMQELKLDKKVALKQASKILESQLKSEAVKTDIKQYYRDRDEDRDVGGIGIRTQARRRAMSTNNYKYQQDNKEVWTAGQNKQALLKTPAANLPIVTQSQPFITHNQPFLTKPSVEHQRQPHTNRTSPLYSISQTPILPQKSALSSTHNQHFDQTLMSQPLPVYSPNSLLSGRPLSMQPNSHRDYISYQREVLRNQKQLIALKYRMECLERKLLSNPKEDGVKNKIRKLSEEIQVKERMIQGLKKI